ncbi:unnamed protein product [Ectocarpus sp. 6 AP-2014]
MKATGPPRYEYRLGFRYVSSNDSSVVESGLCGQRVASSDRIPCLRQDRCPKTSYINEPLRTKSGNTPNAQAAAAHDVTGRDLAAIQIQRHVRGWRARVWAVKVMHDRAWRALLLIQAIWRGVLARHKLLRQEGPSDSPHEEENEYSNISFHMSKRQRSKGPKLATPSVGRISEQQPNRRCPERAAWEQSWARVCLERPSFRDRVRVWQSIAELKRAGGRGRMGITNKEAWSALCQSSGSASVAAALLSNEEYLLGRRLQQQDGRWRLDEIPPYLRLDGGPVVSAGPLFRQTLPPSVARPFSAGVRRCDRLPVMEKGKKKGSGSTSDIGVFNSVSSLFYDIPRTAATATTIPAEGLSKDHQHQQRCLYSTQ